MSEAFKPKYRFYAEFEDGDIFKQYSDDVSKIDNKRSSFYDLLQDRRKIVKFSLRSWNKCISVDLIDGSFEVNFQKIYLGELPPGNVPLTLKFFRQHQHDAVATYKLGADKKITDIKETAHRVKYFLGWETTIKGKHYEQLLGIS